MGQLRVPMVPRHRHRPVRGMVRDAGGAGLTGGLVEKAMKRGRKIMDLRKMKFGKLTAMIPSGKSKRGQIIWLCRCDCGAVAMVFTKHLRSGHTRSCGCLRRRKRVEYEANPWYDEDSMRELVHNLTCESSPDGASSR